MVADSRHREKPFKIEKKNSESRKNFQNREENFGIQKNILESKKKLWNLEKKIKIEKNISESRKLFQNRENSFKIEENISESRNILLLESRKIFLNSMNLPANIYLFQVNNRNTKKRCEICSKLIIKTVEWRQWHHFYIFIVNFEHIPHLHCFCCWLWTSKC